MAVDKEIEAGNKKREDRKFEEAIVHYDNALRENPRALKAHYEKSIALQRLGRYDDAAVSLAQAQKIALERGSRTFIGKIIFRNATLYTAKGDVALASKFLRTAEDYDHDPKEIALWKSQIQNKARKLGIEYDPEAKFESLADLPAVEVPELPVVDSNTPKIEELKEAEPSTDAKKEEQIQKEKKELEEKMKNKDNLYPKTKDIKRDWFQSADQITVSLFIKNLPQDERLKVKMLNNLISVEFPTSPSSEFQYEIGPLYADIVPEKSSFRVFSTKVEFYLVKESSTIKWKYLERSEDPNYDSSVITSTIPAEDSTASSLKYPTSSKKNIDWNKLTLNDDDDEDSKDENAFFRELYKNADDDTKKAMMKSYTESNGTALSTNWEEVSKTKYETSPPDGMEAKKW